MNTTGTSLSDAEIIKACNEKIKEQQAEMIEANLNNKWLDRYNEKCIEIVKLNHAVQAAKSEAVKEFAERLKALLPYDGMSPEGRFKFGRIKSLDIDTILKEME